MKFQRDKIPKFKTEAEEAEFWQKHSPLEFEGELKEVENIHFPSPKRSIVAIKMNDQMVKTLKDISGRKGIGFSSLIRMWVLERLKTELPAASWMMKSP